MSDPAFPSLRRWLWIGLLLVLPVPYVAVESGRVPTLWLTIVGGLALAASTFDGGEITGIFARLYLGQALVAVLLLRVLAHVGARQILARVAPERRRVVGAGLALAAVAVAAAPSYRASPVRDGRPTHWLGIFRIV